MKTLALALTFAVTSAAYADSAWVQATDHGYEARFVTSASQCPVLRTDTGDHVMTVRAQADANFELVCSAPLGVGVKTAQLVRSGNAAPIAVLPVPVAQPQRILVVGDTGCRIKGSTAQDCNDPEKWPFLAVSRASASLKPDLIIHVGDYLYRENKCPDGNAGCAGSPWGDNWTTWNADFFEPAAALLAAAPIVLVRGNHESCNRAGPGWLRLQGPGTYDPAAPCLTHVPQFLVDLGGLKLAVLDDNNSDETSLDRDQAAIYAAELSQLTDQPGPIWLVHHRPIWAAIQGALGVAVGGNRSLVQATSLQVEKHQPPIPQSVSLMLSGHIHTFESINYDRDVPPQIVAGNGGDSLNVTPKDLRGAIFLGASGVGVKDGLSVGGFGFLLMTKAVHGWIIDLYDPHANPKGQCVFTEPNGKTRGRLDCPGLQP